MTFWTRTCAKLRIMKDLIRFFWDRKLWWLIPMLILLLAFGAVLIFAHGSAVAPFIYTLF